MAQALPEGWRWRTGLDEPFGLPYEELLDDGGKVVASIDRLASPPEYTVGGVRRVIAPEDWHATPSGNVATAGMPDLREAVAEELGLGPRQSLDDACREAREAAGHSTQRNEAPATARESAGR